MIRHLDPASPSSKNCYAVALYDAYVLDVLFGEVMITPEWTQTSQDSSNRQNTGVPPPPEPILPSQFTIQLYNPDHQIVVRHKSKGWSSSPAWEFEMPQQTFRQPSNSTLDRSQSDPAVLDATPKLKFSWRKDGTISKDFSCYLSNKTTAPDDRKSKEPDITVSIFTGFKELTLYEPNLSRVEMEDLKGLEIVLMLSAIVIRDVFFRPLKDTFHISNPPTVAPTLGGRKISPAAILATSPIQQLRNELPAGGFSKKAPPKLEPAQNTTSQETQPPRLDPRSHWEIEAERARLRNQQEAEARERKKREQEQERKTRKLLEAEERAARKKQAEIDKETDRETERLKKLYGSEEQQYRAQQPGRAHPQPRPQSVAANLQNNTQHHPAPWRSHLNVPTSEPRPRPTSSFGAYQSTSTHSAPQLKEKKSFFGFRRNSVGEKKLSKQKSVIF